VTIASSEVNELRELSAKLGHNPLLVQAASGNTSLKADGTLWIKASGKWMADANWTEIFVPVGLESLERREGNLAPSIETAMHAVLPHRVVVHVHSVNTISWAVRADGRDRVSERLAGLPWTWIPYTPSGVPLACQIQLYGQRFGNSFPDVFVLANHGLVIAAEDCEAAEALLDEVERRLEVEPRHTSGPNRTHLAAISRGSGYHAPAELEVHVLGVDPLSRSMLLDGTLYPCHAMFLGQAAAECRPFETVSEAVDRYEQCYGTLPSCIAIAGEGLLVTDQITVTQMQVLVGLAEVIQRIPAGAPIRYLTSQEIDELMTTDAHQYRANVEARAALAIR
jgi:rhamnose utilization protein RhaD (predicted bifunctional aldolase and dehydrogenase)